MKSPLAADYRQDLADRAETALERRHTRQAEKLAEQLVRENPADPQAVSLLARAVAARGQIQRAVRLLRQAGADSNPDLCLVLARVLATAGRWKDARQAYVSGLRQRPQETLAWLELADLLRQQGDVKGAAEAYANSIRSDPMRQEGYLRLGELLQRTGVFDRAIAVYKEGLNVLPRSPELLCDLGAALLSTRQVDAAVEALGRSLSLKPVNDSALFNLGSALLERGDFLPAECRFQQLLKLRPQMADAWYRKMLCRPQTVNDETDVPAIERLIASRAVDTATRATAWYALAKLHDDLDHCDQAFAALTRANQIRAETLQHDPIETSRRVDETIRVFDAALYARGASPSDRGSGLVFLMGAPRSGLTLVEQVLGAHSQIANLGGHDGLDHLRQHFIGGLAVGSAGYPEGVRSLDAMDLTNLATRYQSTITVRAPVITDRSPANTELAGLIALLFPAARFIHVRRDPRDSLLSQYFRDGDRRQAHACDLEHLAAWHQDQQRLLAHWRTLWPERILSLDYENLVTAFDPTLARVTRFLDLQPEPAMQQFPARRNAVPWDSAWGVRQPPYRDSIGRWRRYQQHLGPILELS